MYSQPPLPLPEFALLFPKEAEPTHITSEQRNQALDLLWSYNRLAWFGAFLEGLFDTRIAGKGNRIVRVSFKFEGYNTCVTLVRQTPEGNRDVCFILEPERRKTLQALRWTLRNKAHRWKRDKSPKVVKRR